MARNRWVQYQRLHKLKLNILLLLTFTFFASLRNETLKCLKGYYIDKWKYQPQKHDSTAFEFYGNGTRKMYLDGDYYCFDYYIDSSCKLHNRSFQVYEMTRANIKDSFLSVYFYDKRNANYKTELLRRESFKESGGCFRFENKHSEVWYKYAECFYKYDHHNNPIEMVEYLEDNTYRDTFRLFYNYTYDNAGRILTKSSLRGDSMTAYFEYEYKDNFKKTTEYYGNMKLKVVSEEHYKDSLLIQELIEHYYWSDKPYLHDNRYIYDKDNCLLSMTTYLTRDTIKEDLIRERIYHYIE